jgi:hypothetical protein
MKPRNCDGKTWETWADVPDEEDEICPGCELSRQECAELCEEADILDAQERSGL